MKLSNKSELTHEERKAMVESMRQKEQAELAKKEAFKKRMAEAKRAKEQERMAELNRQNELAERKKQYGKKHNKQAPANPPSSRPVRASRMEQVESAVKAILSE